MPGRKIAAMSLSTPASLLDRLRDRHADADWRRFHDIYAPLLHRWLKTHRVPASDQDDVVADLLTVLVAKVPDFSHTGRKGAFRAWLRRILVFRVKEYWRNRATRPADLAAGGDGDRHLDFLAQDDHELSRGWDEEHDRYVVARLLAAIRGEFSESLWRAFDLYAMQGRPADEVAADLGTTLNAVYLARAKILRRLRVEGAGLVDS